jgi:hypothetical protein
MSRKSGRLSREGRGLRSRLSSGGWRRRLAYASGIASLGAVPLIAIAPLPATLFSTGAGAIATLGAHGAAKPQGRFAHVTTEKRIRELAREYKEGKLYVKKKG